jgi:serine/threonine protein phosphatase PrpC
MVSKYFTYIFIIHDVFIVYLLYIYDIGLWDVISNQECVNYVRRKLFKHGNIMKIAEGLIARAMERGSSDNISVVICCLNQVSSE